MSVYTRTRSQFFKPPMELYYRPILLKLERVKNDPEDFVNTDDLVRSPEIATLQGLRLSPPKDPWTDSPAVLPPQTL